MNRKLFRLVFNCAAGMMLPVAETTRSHGKMAGGPALAVAVLAGVLWSASAQAELPVPSQGGAISGFVTHGQASFQANGAQALVNQVGNKSILNWQSFNVSPGHNVQFRQVDSLAGNNPVAGANFTSLNRIWDTNPSVIAGSISQAAGQKANVILVNTNGIAFMGGSQVNLNSFTASSLNIADNFVLNALLGDNLKPQFEGSTGFVKVFEGARITAGSQGRVMLVAPTVVNRGQVEAPDGQVILAAGTKVYLRSADDANLNVRGLLVEVDSPADVGGANAGVRSGALDGQAVALANAADDRLGHATNLGELSSPRGNVTMVGYAVNQKGIARATTSVVANGSVYLMAKDSSVVAGSSRDSSRGGRVVLGEGSRTEVLPETADTTATVDGSSGAGLAQRSEVVVLGQTVYVGSGATVDVPSGRVDLIALDDPSSLRSRTVLDQTLVAASPTARVHIASGARINVAGLSGVEVSAARNSVEVELRGDELKDSPINQQGPLRGEKAYVDINRALANANAGKSTLIAKDSLESYQARAERTVAERSTAGGTVNIRSQGETILEAGAVVDLSGGSLVYTPASVKTTLLNSGGTLTDLADADAQTRYDGIATRYVVDYGRWNRKEVIDLGQSFRFDPGYAEGKDAGSLNIQSMGSAFMQADVRGRTTVGELQRAAGLQPKGATLAMGTPDVGEGLKDFKLNQKVVIDRALASLPPGFSMDDVLPDELKDVLALDSDLLGRDKVAMLKLYTNQAAEVRAALKAPQGGGVTVTANHLALRAGIDAPGGSIALAARNNVFAPANDPLLQLADGVSLTARGAWVNSLPGMASVDTGQNLTGGGSISLAADARATAAGYESRGTVALGQGVQIDAGGGAWMRADGSISAGKGGSVSLEGYAIEGLAHNLFAYGLDAGGKLEVSAHGIHIGGTAPVAFGTLQLDPSFFTAGGFADIALTALSSLEVAPGTAVLAQVVNRRLAPTYATQATGSLMSDFSQPVLRDDRERPAAGLSLAARQGAAGTGDLRIGAGARVEVDPGGRVALGARNLLDIQGSVVARGGAVDVVLDRSSGTVSGSVNENLLWLGRDAQIDVSGITRTYQDDRGLTLGKVLDGGSIRLSARTGYVVAEEGARISVAGAAPVRLDVPNEAGSLGRVVGSDAGALAVFAEEGILFDATLAAGGGGAGNRGGSLSVGLARNARLENQAGLDAQARVLTLAPRVAPQTAGLAPNAPVPVTGAERARIGTDRLEAAGFDIMAFSSRDAIRLEDGLDLGGSRTLALRELTLDAARIETSGGDARLHADTLRLGNYDTENRVGADGPYTVTGSLQAHGRLLELAGDLRLRGMERAVLAGDEMVRLAGVTHGKLTDTGASTDTYEHSANIRSTADLSLQGAVIAPDSFAQVRLAAPGRTIRFTGNGSTATQPLSALGSIQVEAADIVQAGNLWAPLGRIDLAASNALTLAPGSLTSVAAAPGSLLPMGQVRNGRDWVVNVNAADTPKGQIVLDGLPEKSVRLSGARVDMQAGATVDLAGGGDLQAYEFTVGPGGSRDILAGANSYAVLPGYRGGFAPADPQEAFDRRSGESVYLSGVPGLADGSYTLLPAHYALLPGAFAVRLNSGAGNLLPGHAYTRQDGVRVAVGYLTDTRAGAPRDAGWSAIEVLSRDQVMARSEFTLSSASGFFAGGNNLPQDAGLLSVATQGLLQLDATYRTAAAPGGRGASVDINAPRLVVGAAGAALGDPAATLLDVQKLNGLGAESLVLGATRARSGATTTLDVGSDTLTLANDANNPLTGAELILAARDTLTLQPGSAIDAQGAAGDAGRYVVAGNGALVRAGSASASLERSGSPDRSQGVLNGAAGSVVRAAGSITLDATRDNAFRGEVQFRKDGAVVAGNLAVGATRVSFGAAPGLIEGITYGQAALDSLNSLDSLTLTSYSTFDLYGDVRVGGVDGQGKATLERLTLQGAGLAGLDNEGQTAQLRARSLVLTNPSGAAFAAGGATGSGRLEVLADSLVLGSGAKAIQGYAAVQVVANEMVGRGTGTNVLTAGADLQVARISAEKSADQSLRASGPLTVSRRVADRPLAPVDALGARWELSGAEVAFDAQAALPSGRLTLAATTGNLVLGAYADLDVAGRSVAFFDTSRTSPGGSVELVSQQGDVVLQSGAQVNVSGARGGDAGSLVLRATKGAVVAGEGTLLSGLAPLNAQGRRGDGARVELDVDTVGNFSAINTLLNRGGFDGARGVRVRSGDLAVAASDRVVAQEVRLAVDNGSLDVRGEIRADGNAGGNIRLFSGGRLTVADGAVLSARALQDGGEGGSVTLGSTHEDTVLAGGSIDTSGAGGGRGGSVVVQAGRFDSVAWANLYGALPDTGTANNYAVSLNGVTASSLLRGLAVAFTPRFTNTAASRLNLSGAGAKDIWFNGAVVTANRIRANETVYMVYDGTRFHIVDAAFANRTASALLGTSATIGTTTTNYLASQSGVTAYRPGMTLVYTPDADNIGNVNRLNINNLGVKDIRYNNAALAAGVLKAGEPVYLVYDGTAFQLALEANVPRVTGSATALALSAPRTVSAGNSFAFVANANSAAGATTLTINGVTGSLLKNGVNLKSGDLLNNELAYASYDGTSFHLLTELAAKVDVGQGVRVTSVAGDYSQPITTTVIGASSIAVEAVRHYEALARTGGGVLDANRISADTYRYLPGAARDGLGTRLAGASPTFDVAAFHLRPATGITYQGDMALVRDINLADYRYGTEAGTLTVRAEGNLLLNGNLSDGFSHATAFSTGTTPATLLAGPSWSYRLVAGADRLAADPLAAAQAKDFTLAAGKLVRTGTGDIQIQAGRDIKLASNASVIYTAGRVADPVPDFTPPLVTQRPFFSQDGGDVSLGAQRDIVGAPSAQLYSDWLFRQGRLNDEGAAYATSQGSPAWWVRFDQFRQGVGALGGGDVNVRAGGKVENLSASAPTQGRMGSATPDADALVKSGGGSVRVQAGTDLLGGQYFADDGNVLIKAGGQVGSAQTQFGKPVYTVLALGDGETVVQALGDLNIHAILNPQLLVQSFGSNDTFNIGDTTQRAGRKSLFSTYADSSSVSLASLNGNVTLHNTRGSDAVADLKTVYPTVLDSQEARLGSYLDLLSYLPPSLSAAALQGDVVVHDQPAGGALNLMSSAQGQLELLARGALQMNASITMGDRDPARIASATRPASSPAQITAPDISLLHAGTPVHTGDANPVRLYATEGDVRGVSLAFGDGSKNTQVDVPKSVAVRAGRDVRDFSIRAQHPNATDRSVVEAGRDMVFSVGSRRTDSDGIRVAGIGDLAVTAGRNIDLGTSDGLISLGDLENANLPAGGANIQVLAGAGSRGLDVAGTLSRLVAQLESAAPDDFTVWLARWLTGNGQLDMVSAPGAVRAVAAQSDAVQRLRVRELVFSALRETGRDANGTESAYAGDFTRGYAALELVFPGIGAKAQDGVFTTYGGDINLFASRIKTERGGNIELMAPGGDLIVGLANTPAELVDVGNRVLGMVAATRGDIKGFARGDTRVNQSRILTVGGGDVLLWSSEGDIDAGKGKKTASAVPPPIIKVDSQGNVTQELQGAASGSGIGALSTHGVRAGDVDLIAPRGTVNAGDAGIRAGNLNIAAQVVLGADNISVSGTSTGTPVADTSAITAAASGATTGGDEVARTTAALNQSAAQSAQAAQALGDAFKPSLVRVDVLGFGE